MNLLEPSKLEGKNRERKEQKTMEDIGRPWKKTRREDSEEIYEEVGKVGKEQKTEVRQERTRPNRKIQRVDYRLLEGGDVVNIKDTMEVGIDWLSLHYKGPSLVQ